MIHEEALYKVYLLRLYMRVCACVSRTPTATQTAPGWSGYRWRHCSIVKWPSYSDALGVAAQASRRSRYCQIRCRPPKTATSASEFTVYLGTTSNAQHILSQHAARASRSSTVLVGGSPVRFDFDSTAVRPRYDHSTTYVTIVGLPGCGGCIAD